MIHFMNSKLMRDGLLRSVNPAGKSRFPCGDLVLEKRRVACSGAPAGHPTPIQPEPKDRSLNPEAVMQRKLKFLILAAVCSWSFSSAFCLQVLGQGTEFT